MFEFFDFVKNVIIDDGEDRDNNNDYNWEVRFEYIQKLSFNSFF